MCNEDRICHVRVGKKWFYFADYYWVSSLQNLQTRCWIFTKIANFLNRFIFATKLLSIEFGAAQKCAHLVDFEKCCKTHTESGQTLQGSFSAVSKPNFASKYSLESSRRELHTALLCTVLYSQIFVLKLRKIFLFLPIFVKFCSDVWSAKNEGEILLDFAQNLPEFC